MKTIDTWFNELKKLMSSSDAKSEAFDLIRKNTCPEIHDI